MIRGRRVQQLRVMLGLTQADLANRVLLRQYTLSRIEQDQVSCGPETAEMLAVELGVTTDYLHRAPTESMSAHSPQFRSRSSVTQRDRQSAMEWARLVHEEYERLLADAVDIASSLPSGLPPDPIQAAQELRAALGFNQTEPLPYLVLPVERLGVHVLGLPYALSTMDAFSAWRGRTPVVGLLAGVPADRMRFTLAHELGHLVLHSPGDSGQDVEAEADRFAAELLTPRSVIADALPSAPTLNSLTMVKTQWGVSIKSLVRRARELGVIDQERALSLYKQMSKRGWNRGEPGYVPPEKPRAFRKLAEIAYGPAPNIERMSVDAGWSEDTLLRVLGEHASGDELPRKVRSEMPNPTAARSANVVYLSNRFGSRSSPSSAAQ